MESRRRQVAGSILGAVLVGGGSRRMGRDKALLPLGGVPLAVRVAWVLAEVFPEVVLVGRPGGAAAFPGQVVIPDRFPGLGPQAGLHAALLHGGGRAVFLAACDLPGLGPELVRYVAGSGEGGSGDSFPAGVAGARVPVAAGRLQPLSALYSGACLPVVEENLRQGRLAMEALLARIEVSPLPLTPALPFFHEDLLANVNDLRDFRRIEGRFRK